MCLILTENSEIKVAKEDIVCYKVVRKTDLGLYESEFYIYPYTMGTLNTSVPGITINTFYHGISGCITGYKPVVETGFHSFTCKKDAYEYAVCAANRMTNKIHMVVVKCIIPKGANYIEGIYEVYPNYVSDKIICLGEI